jgi:hypothetical protein
MTYWRYLLCFEVLSLNIRCNLRDCLQMLFSRDDISSVMSHDKIVKGSKEWVLIDRQARKVAERAVRALKQSRRAMQGTSIGVRCICLFINRFMSWFCAVMKENLDFDKFMKNVKTQAESQHVGQSGYSARLYSPWPVSVFVCVYPKIFFWKHSQKFCCLSLSFLVRWICKVFFSTSFLDDKMCYRFLYRRWCGDVLSSETFLPGHGQRVFIHHSREPTDLTFELSQLLIGCSDANSQKHNFSSVFLCVMLMCWCWSVHDCVDVLTCWCVGVSMRWWVGREMYYFKLLLMLVNRNNTKGGHKSSCDV